MKPHHTLVILVVFFGRPLPAAEPARAFLDGLRSRGYHDTAMDYLDQMQVSSLAPAELRDSILYEKSQLLVDASRSERDSAVRVRQINQAQQWLEQFIRAQSTSPKINAARNQIGGLFVERARLKYEDSKQNNDQKLADEARQLYEQSFQVFSELQESVAEQLESIPKVLNTRDREEAKLIEKRTQLRADYLQTELFSAAVREELADILPAGSDEQTKLILEAANMYDGIYKDYRTRLAGRYARMYQGRCYWRLGRTKEALGYFGELLDQPNEPESLMMLKAKTLAMAMEAWLSPAEKKYVEAIKRAVRWFDETPADKQREPQWVMIRYHLARALKMQADAASREQPPDRALAAKSLAAATNALKVVASESGEYQEDAQQMLSQLGESTGVQQSEEPETFMAAQGVAKESLDAIGPLTAKIATLESQLASATDAGQKTELGAKLDLARQELTAAQDDAITNYRLALQLADDQTPPSNINLVRYFLCYVYFLKQDYFDAALVGEFVARRYPSSAGAKQCAKIVMASYLKLAEQSEEKAFETDRLESLGEFVSTTWPGEPETLQTVASLIPFLINAGQPMRAAAFVQQFPKESPARLEFEWLVGQSIWGAHRLLQQEISSSSQDGAASDRKPEAKIRQLDRLKTRATQLLTSAFGNLPDEPQVDQASATGALSLAQVHVEDQEFDQAIDVLEHGSLGPMTLVKEGSAVASNPVFVEETYRTALRSYVGQLGSGGDAVMQKTKKTIAALQEFLGQDEAGKQRMLGVYVNLAQDVQRQMETASPEAKLQMSGVFEAFLGELSEGSDDLSVLNWVADTFAKLAAGFDDGQEFNENSRRYYEQSAAAFENLLTTPGLTPALATQSKAQLAQVRFHLGQFDPALALYQEVLRGQPNSINVQVAAARLLQKWGGEDPSRYEQAISGIEGQSIWGWGKISLVAVRHQQFRDTFYESRFELASCQVAVASTKSGQEKSTLLQQAKNNLSKTMKLYPSMGQWKDKYESLLAEIR